MKRRGLTARFTLVEMLMVIAIIAIAIALLLPAMRNMTAHSRNIQCMSQLQNLGSIFSLYQDDYQGWDPKDRELGLVESNPFIGIDWLNRFYAAEYFEVIVNPFGYITSNNRNHGSNYSGVYEQNASLPFACPSGSNSYEDGSYCRFMNGLLMDPKNNWAQLGHINLSYAASSNLGETKTPNDPSKKVRIFDHVGRDYQSVGYIRPSPFERTIQGFSRHSPSGFDFSKGRVHLLHYDGRVSTAYSHEVMSGGGDYTTYDNDFWLR